MNELAGEQKATGESRQAESSAVLEAIDQAREAMDAGNLAREQIPPEVVGRWLDCIEEAVRGTRYTWHHDEGASDARLQEGYYTLDEGRCECLPSVAFLPA